MPTDFKNKKDFHFESRKIWDMNDFFSRDFNVQFLSGLVVL